MSLAPLPLWAVLFLLATLALSILTSIIVARKLATLRRSYAESERTAEVRARELGEALERQRGTAEILRVISSYPTTAEPVFDAILDNALRLCGADLGFLFFCDGDAFRLVADRGAPHAFLEARRGSWRVGPHTGLARAIAERRPIQIDDVRAERAYAERDPARVETVEVLGARTCVWVPMLKERVPVGVVTIWRREVQAFTASQIDLLATFADHAVIAIENVRLFKELEARNAELTEALEHQTATAEILRVISSSPTDLQPVLDTVAANSARLCEADGTSIYRVEGDVLRLVAAQGPIPDLPVGSEVRMVRSSVNGRAVLDGQTVHVHDLAAEVDTEFTDAKARQQRHGVRTVLATPLVRTGVPIGSIFVRRGEVRPFSERQVRLLKTFADQAVIAIENVRLFQELEARNRELTEALEQQTATSEILGVISRTQTHVQPVFETIARSAARLCDANFCAVYRFDDELIHLAAHSNFSPEALENLRRRFPMPTGNDSPVAQVIRDRRSLHIADLEVDPGTPEAHLRFARILGYRGFMAVPMLREGRALGCIALGRVEVGYFPDNQVRLVQTFADQAAIAIDNVRLFTELQTKNADLTEALEQQTVTAEILRVIARSPTDLQPVLEAVTESAVRLCEGSDASLYRVAGDRMRMMTRHGATRTSLNPGQTRPITRGSVSGRAIVDRQTVHLPDMSQLDLEHEFPDVRAAAESERVRTCLATPLLREGVSIGAIVIRRTEVRPFSEKQIALLQTFADQAVIAIENVRLFQELEARNRELTEALEQQTATADILGAISSSPTDVQPVFDTIVRNVVRLCDGLYAAVFRFDGELVHLVATHNVTPEALGEFHRSYPMPPSRKSLAARAILDRAVVHVPDVESDPDVSVTRQLGRATGFRSALAVPMLREGHPIGTINVARVEPTPFPERQIALVKTFADQAVIAIENVRLFQELQARNRDLTEALARQTATAEVLRVISRSQTDLQPVFGAILESAVRLCAVDIGSIFRIEDGCLVPVETTPNSPESWAAIRQHYPRPVDTTSLLGRAAAEGKVVHMPDAEDPTGPPRLTEVGRRLGIRSQLSVPMLRGGEPIGVIGLARRAPGPFSDAQIELIKTFADQAVIAIENARLLGELQARTRELARSVEELKALGEVGRAVSSTLDLQTVLATIVARAVQLSGTDGGAIYEFDETAQEFELRATQGMSAEVIEAIREARIRLGESAVGRAALNREPEQIADIHDEPAYALRHIMERAGFRAFLAVPLLREERIIGALVVRRREPGAFPEETVKLMQTFAAQSVLAIQNARLFREIEEKGQQLAIASRHKSQFLANMSHELRTPLNAILGYSELILDNIYGEVPGKIREVMERVDKSGRHLLGLINDVLDLSKIEAGQLTLALAEYSMNEVVQTVFTAVESLAAEKKLALRVAVAPDLPPGRGDERRLTQVLLNLVGNAIKFTEAGEVRIDAAASDGAFVVSVADTGPGISETDQQKIFQEFQQADSSSTRKKGGTGLGLSIAKRIIELHGGRLWVESRPGRGSTFAFTLPVRVERQASLS